MIYFSSKDGVKTLASKLRTHDCLGQSLDNGGKKEHFAGETLNSGLSFEQRLQLQEREVQMLELRTKISQEHKEISELERKVEREQHQAEKEAEKEGRICHKRT